MKKLISCCFIFSLFISANAKPINKIEIPRSPLWKKLNSIIIRNFEVEDADAQAVIRLLQLKSKALDPEGKGINFVSKGLKNHSRPVTLKLSNLPLAEVLRYVCLSSQLIIKVEDDVVIIKPRPFKKNKRKK